MQFSLFLKKLLNEFVEMYKKYFSSTVKAALLWTILCFAIVQVLATYCTYDPGIRAQPVSVLSFFILKFSINNTYSFVDLTRTLFIFFVAIFSVNLNQKVTMKSILYLLGTLIVCALLDCALFRLNYQLQTLFNTNPHALIWINEVVLLLRNYLPLILFALIIQLCLGEFTTKHIGFLLISLWLFNELAYEFIMLIRPVLFSLLMITLKPMTWRYVIESVLGIPLIAFLFLGYYCAMTAPFYLPEEEK
ncbi:hypothetical protein HDF19_07910 [Mucilaginibacter sp. E4BP6]|uniref:hypothetical protein n=1 Tax=Mucilaginibacter sp. E4BP6 TaxID=2723089 RepID=UPI0015C7FE80|nr:hypothetical protein [Mucilaginibacter sp. E4BP6]NYE67534.1 hypothetical protein [Mucilaginibacter sp. E4BP6]